jgi:hypothetical protein
MSAATGLPIVIGLETQGGNPLVDAWGLREFLETEFRARRERYPDSPFVLHLRAGPTLSETARAAADACGIAVIEPPDGVLALFCHLLFHVAVQRASDAEGEPSAGGPLDGTLIEFDADTKVELIELTLLDAGAPPRQRTVRFGVADPVRTGLYHPSPENPLMMRTDRFNRDALRERAPGGAAVGAAASIDAWHRRADALALVFQRKVHRAFRVIFVLASVGAVFYGCFLTVADNRVPLQDLLLIAYVALIVASYGVYLFARHRDLHARFVEYRTLAEGLRVQQYWHACGVTRPVAAGYLIRQGLEYQWVRLALWRVAADNPPHAGPAAAGRASAANALQSWIDGQEEYFRRTQARSARIESRVRYLVAGIFLAGVGASVLIMLEQHMPVTKANQLRVSLVSFLCPSVSAAIVALVTKLGLLYQARHYGRMKAVFDQARRRLLHHPAGATARIATALGEEALLEIESWAQFRRERGMDEPASPFRRPW